MLRAQGKAVHQCDSGWVPVFVDQEQSISLMSVGFLLENPDEAVVWRGPKKHGKNSVRPSPPADSSVSLYCAYFSSYRGCCLWVKSESSPGLLVVEILSHWTILSRMPTQQNMHTPVPPRSLSQPLDGGSAVRPRSRAKLCLALAVKPSATPSSVRKGEPRPHPAHTGVRPHGV